MFTTISQAFSSIIKRFQKQLHVIFSKPKIDQATIDELYTILLSSDVGVITTNYLINKIKDQYKQGNLQSGTELECYIKQELTNCIAIPTVNIDDQSIVLLVGINGSGKTTLAAKLGHYYAQQSKRVLFVAADTFRAAAVQQLESWASRLNADIVTGKEGQDPASVVFEGCKKYLDGHYDVLIIDTAGRLQTKENLMRELEKIKRTILKALPNQTPCTLLTVDALLGQSSLQQAHVFNQSTQLTGIVLTKMDSSAKGGIAFAISHELTIPVMLISLGEKVDALEKFSPTDYINGIMSE